MNFPVLIQTYSPCETKVNRPSRSKSLSCGFMARLHIHHTLISPSPTLSKGKINLCHDSILMLISRVQPAQSGWTLSRSGDMTVTTRWQNKGPVEAALGFRGRSGLSALWLVDSSRPFPARWAEKWLSVFQGN